jgi:hypothetical protein
MEIAIPLVALGGMYIISNQPSKNCGPKKNNKNSNRQNPQKSNNIENFTSMKQKTQNNNNVGVTSNIWVDPTATKLSYGNNILPNTDIPAENYPTINRTDLNNNVYYYQNPNEASDKYFNQSVYENRVNNGLQVGSDIQNIYSLTGNYLKSDEFKHNNMVPFYGAKIKDSVYDVNLAETILDNKIGTGSQMIRKVEQAPLFKPEDNVNWAYGMPNNSDFYQSRVNPGMKINNVKPFDSEYVAPGLGQGFTTQGSGGFNSGMEARNSWLPKTVDELRVETNPRVEYELTDHEGPANAYVKNLGKIGRVEKNLPDTFFINTQDRWLTTTGAEKGETLRPIQEMGIVKRADCETEYVGPGVDAKKTSYVPSNFEASKRQPSETCDLGVASALGRGPITDAENNQKSYKNYNNNRSSVRQVDSFRSGFSGAIGAVIAPLMDVLKPSRKDELVNNIRIYGDGGSIVPSNYVINKNDKTATTIKETTLYAPRFNINNQRDTSTYVNTHVPLDLTQRDTTSASTLGFVGGMSTQQGAMVYDSNYAQTNNDIKSQTIYNRPNQGGTQMFNQQMNVTTTRDDANRYDNRLFTPSSIIPLPSGKEQIGKFNTPQTYNENIGCDRISPDLLDAFRQNPYTHPLTTSV